MSGEPVTFEEICKGAIQRVAPEAASRRQRISFSTDGLIGKAQIDPTLLARILQNLLNNAIRFTPESGEIGIDLACIAGGRSVAVTVWDHGCGIAASEQDDLFRPRTQQSKGAASRGGGKSLGLLMVKCLTKRCGGRIEAESEEGKGSRFSVIFPNLGGRDGSMFPMDRKIPVLSCVRQLLLAFGMLLFGGICHAQYDCYGPDPYCEIQAARTPARGNEIHISVPTWANTSLPGFVVGAGRVGVPIHGATLLVTPHIFLPETKRRTLCLYIPNNPWLAGKKFNVQWIGIESHQKFILASNAIEVTIL